MYTKVRKTGIHFHSSLNLLLMFVASLMMQACGGSSSSNDPTEFEASLVLENSALNAYSHFSNEVETGDFPSRKITFSVAYGPGGMSIDESGKITWDGGLDFGKSYEVSYGIQLKTTDKEVLLEDKIEILSSKITQPKMLVFEDRSLDSTYGDFDDYQTIDLVNGAQSLISSMWSGGYTNISLIDNKLVIKNSARDYKEVSSIAAIGYSAHSKSIEILLRASNNTFYSSLYPLKRIEVNDYNKVKEATLLDVDQDGINEIVLRDFENDEKHDSSLMRVYNLDGEVLYEEKTYSNAYAACDINGDNSNELITNVAIHDIANQSKRNIFSILSFMLKSPGLETCDAIISYNSDSDQQIQLRVHNGSYFALEYTKNFANDISFGLRPTLIESSTPNIYFVPIFNKPFSDEPFPLVSTLTINRTTNHISSNTLNFERKLGLTLSPNDFILGKADIDGDGLSEVIMKHELLPGDDAYSVYFGHSDKKNNHSAAHVIVAARLNEGTFTPLYQSEVIIGGNYVNKPKFTPQGKLLISNNYSSYLLNENMVHEPIGTTTDNPRTHHILKSGDFLHLDIETGLSKLDENGNVIWQTAPEALGVYQDYSYAPSISVRTFQNESYAIIKPSPSRVDERNKLINLTNGEVIDGINGTLFYSPDFETTGHFFRVSSSVVYEGVYKASSTGIIKIHDWSDMYFSTKTFTHGWINADNDADYEIISNSGYKEGYTIRDMDGTLVKHVPLTDSSISYYTSFLNTQKCLDWDPDCRLRLQYNSRIKGIDVIDTSVSRIIWSVPGLLSDRAYDWASYVDAQGNKQLALASNELFWFKESK